MILNENREQVGARAVWWFLFPDPMVRYVTTWESQQVVTELCLSFPRNWKVGEGRLKTMLFTSLCFVNYVRPSQRFLMAGNSGPVMAGPQPSQPGIEIRIFTRTHFASEATIAQNLNMWNADLSTIPETVHRLTGSGLNDFWIGILNCIFLNLSIS